MQATNSDGSVVPNSPLRQIEEILQQCRPFNGEETFGMKLDAVQGPGLVADAHDLPFGRPRGDFEVRVLKRLAPNDEAVIAGGVERVRQAGEDPSAVVVDGGHLAVHDPGIADHLAAERMADALMAEADAERRHGRGKAAENVIRHAGLIGRTRPRRDDDVGRPQVGDAIGRDPVVADDGHRQVGVKLPKPLNEVVGERVVIIDQQNHLPLLLRGIVWTDAFADVIEKPTP